MKTLAVLIEEFNAETAAYAYWQIANSCLKQAVGRVMAHIRAEQFAGKEVASDPAATDSDVMHHIVNDSDEAVRRAQVAGTAGHDTMPPLELQKKLMRIRNYAVDQLIELIQSDDSFSWMSKYLLTASKQLEQEMKREPTVSAKQLSNLKDAVKAGQISYDKGLALIEERNKIDSASRKKFITANQADIQAYFDTDFGVGTAEDIEQLPEANLEMLTNAVKMQLEKQRDKNLARSLSWSDEKARDVANVISLDLKKLAA